MRDLDDLAAPRPAKPRQRAAEAGQYQHPAKATCSLSGNESHVIGWQRTLFGQA